MNEVHLDIAASGGSVRLVITEPAEPPIGTVIVGAPFGMQSRDIFPVALTLRRNGFRTVRFEGRDALGGGSGNAFDYRLSTVAEDLDHVIDHVGSEIARGFPVLAVGMSLAARPLVRVLSRRSIDGAVLFTPVFNLRSTLREVCGQDFFAMPEGEIPDTRVIGQMTSAQFIIDARRHAMDELPGTLDELASVRTPCAILCGDEDPWVDILDVRTGAGRLPVSPDVVVIPAASHELNRNPRVAMNYIRQLAAQCLRLVGRDAGVVTPRFSDIISEMGRSGEPQPVAEEAAS